LHHQRLVTGQIGTHGLVSAEDVSVFITGEGARLSTKSASAATTMDGPEGVSNCSEAVSPPATEIAPIIAANTAMISGLPAKRRAVAAGMISSAVISRMPTSFMAMAITAA